VPVELAEKLHAAQAEAAAAVEEAAGLVGRLGLEIGIDPPPGQAPARATEAAERLVAERGQHLLGIDATTVTPGQLRDLGALVTAAAAHARAAEYLYGRQRRRAAGEPTVSADGPPQRARVRAAQVRWWCDGWLSPYHPTS
jgi:hypothetical protein